MGTRSLTFVYNDFKPVMCMYAQWDGYPEGHGKSLADFLDSFEAVTNGIAVGETRKTANGMGCLAAQMIAHFKTGVGNFYLYPTDTTDAGQEYEYHIYHDRVTVYGYNKKHLFTGPWQTFKTWCSSDESEDFTTDEGKEKVKDLLRNGALNVTFIKKDGTERVMTCTLKPELIGGEITTGKRQVNDEVCPVYDLINEGWRSFRWDSVVNVK